MDSSTVLFNQLKAAEPFFLLAGPNVIESEEHILHMAKNIKNITSKIGLQLVFKSSFDKANRTSSKSFRGPGMAEGLKILEKVKMVYDIPIVTDVHEASQCEPVGRVADVVQIPAFLCRQTDLLVAAAKTGKIVNIKKGQFCAPSVMENSAEKVRVAGNQNVMVCERGTMFGYHDLIVDPRNLEWMREANCPVVADITHSLQQPAGKKKCYSENEKERPRERQRKKGEKKKLQEKPGLQRREKSERKSRENRGVTTEKRRRSRLAAKKKNEEEVGAVRKPEGGAEWKKQKEEK